jgi:hypothetical protein
LPVRRLGPSAARNYFSSDVLRYSFAIGGIGESGGMSMKWLFAVALASLSFSPAHAFTCEDVRALSAEQRAYYIRVFNMTPSLQERIRHACSNATGRQRSTSADDRTVHHPEQDARNGQ